MEQLCVSFLPADGAVVHKHVQKISFISTLKININLKYV
jgi:hypothetical protein